jgi:hypothetical protein
MNITLEEVLSMADRRRAYFEVVNLFMQGSDEIRKKIVDGWNFGVVWQYPDQARLACRKGEIRSSEERITASLAYDAIATKENVDFRDTLVAWAVIYNSCLVAQLDPEQIFRRVAAVAEPKVKIRMEQFVERKDDDKSLSAFLLIAKTNIDGEIEIRPS